MNVNIADAVARARDGAHVLVVMPRMDDVPPVLDELQRQLRPGERLRRTNGLESLQTADGGSCTFSSARSARARGRTLDAVYVDHHSVTTELLDEITPGLIGSNGTLDECELV